MKKLLVLTSFMFYLCGCASIFSNKQDIVLVAQDPDATPKINIMANGAPPEMTLPGVIKVKRDGEDILVTINDECYKKNTQIIYASKINPAILINVLGFGVYGSTTDFATGAAWKYDKRVVIYTTPNGMCENK